MLYVDTPGLLGANASRVQLAPYNTGRMHVPTAPKHGPEIFTDLADYPYDQWVAKLGKSADHIVEMTVPYPIPDISAYVIRVETWANGKPVAVLYDR